MLKKLSFIKIEFHTSLSFNHVPNLVIALLKDAVLYNQLFLKFIFNLNDHSKFSIIFARRNKNRYSEALQLRHKFTKYKHSQHKIIYIQLLKVTRRNLFSKQGQSTYLNYHHPILIRKKDCMFIIPEERRIYYVYIKVSKKEHY